MRVVVHSVEDFVENLEVYHIDRIVEKTIWMDQTRRRISEVKFIVNLQAMCVVDIQDGQFLLQYGEDCGADYEDSELELKGTDSANEKRDRLEEWCKLRGLMTKPGVVDF